MIYRRSSGVEYLPSDGSSVYLVNWAVDFDLLLLEVLNYGLLLLQHYLRH